VTSYDEPGEEDTRRPVKWKSRLYIIYQNYVRPGFSVPLDLREPRSSLSLIYPNLLVKYSPVLDSVVGDRVLITRRSLYDRQTSARVEQSFAKGSFTVRAIIKIMTK